LTLQSRTVQTPNPGGWRLSVKWNVSSTEAVQLKWLISNIFGTIYESMTPLIPTLLFFVARRRPLIASMAAASSRSREAHNLTVEQQQYQVQGLKTAWLHT
jgi:hypothetical protein